MAPEQIVGSVIVNGLVKLNCGFGMPPSDRQQACDASVGPAASDHTDSRDYSIHTSTTEAKHFINALHVLDIALHDVEFGFKHALCDFLFQELLPQLSQRASESYGVMTIP